MDAFITRKRRRNGDKPGEAANSLHQEPSISPPPKRNETSKDHDIKKVHIDLTGEDKIDSPIALNDDGSYTASKRIVPSPIQLNYVQDLPAKSNKDAVRLGDILGDSKIQECWLFNYLFDIEFIMKQFDPDVRDTAKIRMVHGSWQADDRNALGIADGARRYPNIQITKAHLPEPFGTHHSKIIVLFRHDHLAQVIILTGNLIERDWSMSQAIWRSPLLPLETSPSRQTDSQRSLPALGTGLRFKHDLLSYFRGYGPGMLPELISNLENHDFSKVKGALVASVPGRQNLQSMDADCESFWGWPGLKRVLGFISSNLPVSSEELQQPHIVAQISSVAAIGEKWLNSTFLPALCTNSLPSRKNKPPATNKKPKVSIVFPTADEVRRCINGYKAGASIHMKISSPAQAKQLGILRPMLCHWAGDQRSKGNFFTATNVREAGRSRAAPHIKTYVRFRDAKSMDEIEWAMVTSANLSTQAWGGATGPSGEVRICSYEIGVVVWPSLWDEDQAGPHSTATADVVARKAKMVPVFKTDLPSTSPREEKADDQGTRGDHATSARQSRDDRVTIGLRMPYDIPLVPYAVHEKPWCASELRTMQ